MNKAEFFNMLKSTGLPVAYRKFNTGEVPPLPYIVFYYPYEHPEAADDKAWTYATHINVELYTANKDFGTEARVEAVLNQNGYASEKSETWIDREQMYEVLYEMEDYLNG